MDRLAQRPALAPDFLSPNFPMASASTSQNDVWALCLTAEAYAVYHPLMNDVLPYCQHIQDVYDRKTRKEWSHFGAVRMNMVGVPGPSPSYQDRSERESAGYLDLGNGCYSTTVHVARRMWKLCHGRECPYLESLNPESLGDHLEIVMAHAYLDPGNPVSERRRDIVELAAKFTWDHWDVSQDNVQVLLASTHVESVCWRFARLGRAETQLNSIRLCHYVRLWLHIMFAKARPAESIVQAFFADEDPRFVEQWLRRLPADEFFSFTPTPSPKASLFN